MERVPIEKLRKLINATHTKKICNWLERNGVPYRLDDAGLPIVLDTALAAAFEPQQQGPGEFAPDFSKLKDCHGKKTTQRRRAA